jgi:hypothetical protein
MNSLKSLRPTPALIVAMAALVLALSGAAIAVPASKKIQTKEIAKGAVTQKKIADGAVASKQIEGKSIKGNRLKDGAVKAKQIADGTITGQKVADDGLSDKNISDYEVIGDNSFVRVTATEAATLPAALAAAPETVLFTKGQLTVYAKCYRDTAAGETRGTVFARTSANGAILQGVSNLPAANATLLDTTTAETDRVVDNQAIAVADAGSVGESESVLIGADGTDLHILSHIAVKQGTFPAGNGAFGDGNVCLFGGMISG